MVKKENHQPGGSIKYRPALAMINKLFEDKKLTLSDTIIEATSGNMGIALALICARLKMKCIIVMSEGVSQERIDILKGYHAEVILTPKALGIDGAIAKVKTLVKEHGYVYPDQFNNPVNPLAYESLAYDLIESLGQIDYFVCGFGTGGTIMGLGRIFKKVFPKIKIIGIEPEESPFVSLNKIGAHTIYGIGINKLPTFFDVNLLDEIVLVTSNEAHQVAQDYYKKGISMGISTAANLIVAKKVKETHPDKVVLTILHDDANKYMSVMDV